MPRATKGYLTDKKSCISAYVGEVLEEKPLYSIAMRNIIKKAGSDQEVIYHYYRSIDEIFVEYINKSTTCRLSEQDIDFLLRSEGTETETPSKRIITIGKYIEGLLKSVGGEACFESVVFYAYDVGKRAAMFPQSKFKQSPVYTQNRILEFILNHIEKGIFYPQIPVQSMILSISSFIDGIAQNAAADSVQGEDISIMFWTLAKAVVGSLEVKHGTDEKEH